MNRRGSALLAALWLVVLLSVATTGVLSRTRTGVEASHNRLRLRRAEWAREACAQLLMSDPHASSPASLSRLDIGGGAWCSAVVTPVASRVHLNLASAELIGRLLQSDSLTAALLDWRDPDDLPRPGGAEAEWYRSRGRRLPRNGPFASVDELALVRGFDSVLVAAARALMTVIGSGTVDLNQAPVRILTALPGMTSSVAEQVMSVRRRGGRLESLGELLEFAGPTERPLLLGAYVRLEAVSATASPLFAASITGGIDGTSIRARLELVLQVVDQRLVVVGRQAL